MKNIKNKTYHNFLIIRNKLMREKGYTPEEASKLTHLIFENLSCNQGRTAEEFYNLILSKEEFEAAYGARKEQLC